MPRDRPRTSPPSGGGGDGGGGRDLRGGVDGVAGVERGVMTGQSDESVVFKWNVPVDDQWHPIGSGPVVLVGCQRGPGVIQVWTREGGGPGGVQGARAFGTGQPVPGDAEHVGSVSHHDSGLVWHVFTTPGNPTLNSPTPPGQTR